MHVRITVPATSANLGPGFDILALALQLQNEVTVTTVDGDGTTLDLGPDAPAELLDPERNLVVQAYRGACEELGVPSGGVHVTCVNRIPLRRGLGSSAAAALAGVLAANALHAGPWDEDAVLERVVALEGHGDNAAAALHGGLVIVIPGAPVVTMDVPDELQAVVLVPDVELATKTARGVLPEVLPRADAVFNAARCALLARAVALSDWETLHTAMEDRWHQGPRTALFPAMPALIAAALDAGARGAALSGAGPAVLALTDGPTVPVAEAMLSAARAAGIGGTTLVSGIRNWGARVDLSA